MSDDDDEMRELERKVTRFLLGGKPDADKSVEVRKRRRLVNAPAKAPEPKGWVEVVEIKEGLGWVHPKDRRYDVVLMTGQHRVKVRADVYYDELEAALKPYRDDGMEIRRS